MNLTITRVGLQNAAKLVNEIGKFTAVLPFIIRNCHKHFSN